MRKLTGFLMMTGFLLTSLLLVGCPGILVTPSSTATPTPISSATPSPTNTSTPTPAPTSSVTPSPAPTQSPILVNAELRVNFVSLPSGISGTATGPYTDLIVPALTNTLGSDLTLTTSTAASVKSGSGFPGTYPTDATSTWLQGPVYFSVPQIYGPISLKIYSTNTGSSEEAFNRYVVITDENRIILAAGNANPRATTGSMSMSQALYEYSGSEARNLLILGSKNNGVGTYADPIDDVYLRYYDIFLSAQVYGSGETPTEAPTASPAPSSSPAPTQDPSNPVFNPSDLPDGWARAPNTGFPSSPGGAAATAENTFTVTNKTELATALSKGTTAKIIYVNGVIDLLGGRDGDWYVANTTGLSQVYANYNDYMAKYAASCYDGALAGLDADQEKLYNKMKADAYVYIPSNTTIIGVGENSGFKSGQLYLNKVTNVVIRNMTIADTWDWFPSWYQSSENNYNCELDCMTVDGSTYVWVDHCTLGDGDRLDSTMPYVTIGSGRSEKWVTHDGLMDIKNGANFVTVSWNIFEDHDKTTLLGSSDSSTSDPGKLKVTFHHNWYRDIVQRLPRVRFGQVHVYNNYYQNVSGYAIGVGDYARVYSESNYFENVASAFSKFDDDSHKGYYIDFNSVFNNLGNGRVGTLSDLGWSPSSVYSYTASSAADAKTAVMAGAGAGN